MNKYKRKDIRPVLITSCLSLGGSTTFLLNLARAFTKAGIEFRIISLEAGNPLKSEFLPFSGKIKIFDHRKIIFEDRVQEVVKLLAFFKPSHVVACLGPSSLEILRYVPKEVGRIGLIQSNDPGPYRSIKRYRKYLDGIGAVSMEILNQLKKTNGFRKKILGDVRYGVGLPKRKPLKNRYLNQRPIRILYCGRVIEEQKRIGLLPQILRQLDHLKVDYRFTLAGDGPDLVKITKALNPWIQKGTAAVLGRISQREVGGIMSLNDIYLLFSDYEGLPLSLLEGMASGLIPVVSDLGQDFKELIKGTGGQLVDPQSPPNYAKAILKISKHQNKLEKYKSLCHEKWKSDFNPEAMIRRWVAFLKDVSSKKRGFAKWDKSPKIQAPLPLQNKKLFHPFFRPFRRLNKLLTQRLCGA
jgi:glycosyltransferase involved in cell wall biosynthesis